jgi:hypothetical protein
VFFEFLYKFRLKYFHSKENWARYDQNCVLVFIRSTRYSCQIFGKTWIDIWYMFVNCKWVATQWQLYNTLVHTNNTQNDTKPTIHSTTQNLRKIQKFWNSAGRLFRQIFQKHSNIKFHENPCSGSRVPCGLRDRRTDRHDEAGSRFSQFCQRT